MQGVIVLIESWYYELWNWAPLYSTHLYSDWMHFLWSETNPEYLGLIYNYNKIWVRAAVWVRKWIDGSDQVSESLLTTALGMGPSQDWALQVVNCLCLVWPAGQRNTQKLILSSQLHSKSKYLVSLTTLFSLIIKICSPLRVWHHHVMYAYVRTTAMV